MGSHTIESPTHQHSHHCNPSQEDTCHVDPTVLGEWRVTKIRLPIAAFTIHFIQIPSHIICNDPPPPPHPLGEVLAVAGPSGESAQGSIGVFLWRCRPGLLCLPKGWAGGGHHFWSASLQFPRVGWGRRFVPGGRGRGGGGKGGLQPFFKK